MENAIAGEVAKLRPPPLPTQRKGNNWKHLYWIAPIAGLALLGAILGDEGTGFRPSNDYPSFEHMLSTRCANQVADNNVTASCQEEVRQWGDELNQRARDPRWQQHMLDEAERGNYVVGPPPLHNMPILPRDDVAPGDNVHRLY